jgi:NAD-dependent deacetylase
MHDTSKLTAEHPDVRRVAELISSGGRVVALTGAGVSTDSGIPDFRGPQGVWTKNPGAERLSTIQHYMSDPEVRAEVWRGRLENPVWSAQPGPGHRVIAEMERRGHLDTLITQNIDGLHQIAGSSADRTIEIHGTVRDVVCMNCAERTPAGMTLERVRGGERDPDCRSCGGILKSATISFGQQLVEADLRRSESAAANSDLFLAIGTSLVVYPVAALPQIALDAGARLVVINGEPTPYDGVADVVLTDRIGEVLPAIASHWP